MKIAFTGPSGTGKTTLARALSERYGVLLGYWGSRYSAALLGFSSPYSVDAANLDVYVDYRANGCEKRTAALNAMSAYKFKPRATCRELFQRTVLSSKRDHEQSISEFITDRCYLDDHVYSLMAGSKAGDRTRAIMETADAYDVVFYMSSIRFQNIDGDPDRIDDPEYHATFTAHLEKLIGRVLLQPSGCAVIRLASPTQEGVLREAVDHLKRLGIVEA